MSFQVSRFDPPTSALARPCEHRDKTTWAKRFTSGVSAEKSGNTNETSPLDASLIPTSGLEVTSAQYTKQVYVQRDLDYGARILAVLPVSRGIRLPRDYS